MNSIISTFARGGFASIDPGDLRGRFRWYGLYTQRKPGIDGGKTATLEPHELDDDPRSTTIITMDPAKLAKLQAQAAANRIGAFFPRRDAEGAHAVQPRPVQRRGPRQQDGTRGARALGERRFDDRVFVISFVSNVVIAALIVFLGDQLGVGSQLSTGVVVVLGIRIFANAAAIRRQIFHA